MWYHTTTSYDVLLATHQQNHNKYTLIWPNHTVWLLLIVASYLMYTTSTY